MKLFNCAIIAAIEERVELVLKAKLFIALIPPKHNRAVETHLTVLKQELSNKNLFLCGTTLV